MNGRELIETIQKHTSVKVISFDVFDTILMRKVRKPEEVFQKAGELSHINATPREYQEIRKRAEHMAYRNGEPSFDEVIAGVPQYIGSHQELHDNEIKAEKMLSYINPVMEEVIQWCSNQGYRVIAVSDMYYNSAEIRELLQAAGLDVSVFEQIYVSSEVGQSKYQSTLFPYVAEDMGIKYEEMLHIGDNYMSDVINPKAYGIHTIYYDAVSTEKYNELKLEDLKYGSVLSGMYSMRKLAASLEDDFYHKVGAMIMGPALTVYCEKILDMADERGIHRIYPLMREGHLISRLLENAALYRKNRYDIRPMYISRKAILLPSIKEWNEEELFRLLLVKGGTVGNLFKMLEIPLPEIYQELQGESLEGLRREKDNADSLWGRLYQYLISDKTAELINKNVEKKSYEAYRYVMELTGGQDYITADIGFYGTIQGGLNSLSEKYSDLGKPLHTLMFARADCADKALKGVEIRGLLASYGYNRSLIEQVNAFVFEQFLMCREGTTTGYCDGKAVTKAVDINEEQWEKIEKVQKGILDFQKIYYKASQNNRTEVSTEDAVKVMLRFSQCPTLEEAKKTGALCYDLNYGVEGVHTIVDAQYVKELQALGRDNFTLNAQSDEILWQEGAITQAFPEYYVDKILDSNNSAYDANTIKVVRDVAASKCRRVVVTGAGEAGRNMAKYLNIFNIEVEAYTDNNPKLAGESIGGVPVKRITDTFETDSYVIGSFAYAKELYEQIRREKGEKVQIFGYCTKSKEGNL